MGDFTKNKFASKKQEWATPQDMFDNLNKVYSFDFDLAADEHNHKCARYFTAADDALKKEWHGNCWLNPPYGNTGETRLAKWVEKAHNEANTGNCQVTMLIPARTNTRWWHEHCMKAAEVLFVCGRPRFGDAIYGLPQPLAIITFAKVEAPAVFGTYDVTKGVVRCQVESSPHILRRNNGEC